MWACSLFLSFVCSKGQFSDQNINVAKEAETILRNIEKCDISLFINKQMISFWNFILDDEFPGRKQIIKEYLI